MRGRTADAVRPLVAFSEVVHRLLNRCQNFFVRWKAERILPCDQLLSNPDGELPPVALDKFWIEANLLLDKRRHTGRARPIVSDSAESNADVLHEIYLCSRRGVRFHASSCVLKHVEGFRKRERLSSATGDEHPPT